MKNLILVLFSCAPIAGIMAILFSPLGIISIVALIVTFTTAFKTGIIISTIAVIFIALSIIVAVDVAKELKIKKLVIFLLLLETIAIWWLFYLYAVYS